MHERHHFPLFAGLSLLAASLLDLLGVLRSHTVATSKLLLLLRTPEY